jgi:hypothetical protein
MASGEDFAAVKEFVLEVPLHWGDMDVTPQAFHIMQLMPWRPTRSWRS